MTLHVDEAPAEDNIKKCTLKVKKKKKGWLCQHLNFNVKMTTFSFILSKKN